MAFGRRRIPLVLLILSLSIHETLQNSQNRRLPEQRNSRGHHATSYAQRHYSQANYYNQGYYNYNDDDDIRRYKMPHTTLPDVLLCLVTSLAWAVWLIRSIVVNQNPFQRDDLLYVHGNVLQVEQIPTEGIPSYEIVVDYVLQEQATTKQFRKTLHCDRELAVGFANVELVVVPEDPDKTILKEQLQDHQQTIVSPKWKKLSTVFAALLVLASLAGTIQVVLLLDANERWKGWLTLCLGVSVLWPAGLCVHHLTQTFSKRVKIVNSEQHAGLCKCGSVDPTEHSAKPFQETTSYTVPETSGCYFVYDKKQKEAFQDTQSLSSVSSISEGHSSVFTR